VSDQLHDYYVEHYRSMPAAERKDELEGLDEAIARPRNHNPRGWCRVTHEDDKPLHELFAEIDGNNGFALPDSTKIVEHERVRVSVKRPFLDRLF